MIKLMVSNNCGMSYGLDSEAETVEELQPRMGELNEQVLRWHLEDGDGKQLLDIPCAIHEGILKFITQINEGPQQP